VTERLVVIGRDGVLRLYAINGSGPIEVGTLTTGPIDDETAALVGCAFADLRAAVTMDRPVVSSKPSGIRATMPSASARPLARPLPSGPRTGGLRLPGVRGAAPDPGSLNGRIRAYLTEHGPSTVVDMLGPVRAEATETKSARQRVSTALAQMLATGTVMRQGAGRNSVWMMAP